MTEVSNFVLRLFFSKLQDNKSEPTLSFFCRGVYIQYYVHLERKSRRVGVFFREPKQRALDTVLSRVFCREWNALSVPRLRLLDAIPMNLRLIIWYNKETRILYLPRYITLKIGEKVERSLYDTHTYILGTYEGVNRGIAEKMEILSYSVKKTTGNTVYTIERV